VPRKLLLSSIALILSSASVALAEEAQTGDDYPLIEGCTWKDQTVLINDKSNQKLSFRYQDCDGSTAAKASFAIEKTNVLVQSLNSGASDTVARFWALNGRKPSEVIAEVASPSVAENEKGRCVVHLDYVTGQYSYEPNAAYLEELLALDEPFSACGDFGATNDAIQYFAIIDKALLAFFWVGQETPLFDPNSFHYQNSKKPGVVE
jgi:hypothetical protein